MNYNTLHTTQTEQQEPHLKLEMNSGATEGKTVPAPLVNLLTC